jgi:hypothetical protein
LAFYVKISAKIFIMPIVNITPFSAEFDKTIFIQILRSRIGYPQTSAQRVANKLEQRKSQSVPAYDATEAALLIAALQDIGMSASIADEVPDLEDQFSWVRHACAAIFGFLVGGFVTVRINVHSLTGTMWFVYALLNALVWCGLSIWQDKQFWANLRKRFEG